MIAHRRFGELRLARFAAVRRIGQLANWEYEGRTWVGEMLDGSEWLRLASDPEVLRSLSLPLAALPERLCTRVLSTLELPLRRTMTLGQVRGLLGRPRRSYAFVKGRTTYVFRTPAPDAYDVSCTILDDGGLVYVVVMAMPLPRNRT